MKKILVPLDFSPVSLNALEYAVEIAKTTKAKLFLFHVYHQAFPDLDPLAILPFKDPDVRAKEHMEEIKAKLHEKYGKKLSIESKCTSGTIVDEIELYAQDKQVDLIIMGMTGGGLIVEKFIGSVTSSLIERASWPILVVDGEVRFKSIKKIVFACDYEEDIHKTNLKPLRQIAHFFKSRIFLLHVVPELEAVQPLSQQVETYKLKQELEGFTYNFHQVEDPETVEAINHFVLQKKIDLVVMIPHLHTLWEKLLHEPHSRQMTFHSMAPLLTLPQKN